MQGVPERPAALWPQTFSSCGDLPRGLPGSTERLLSPHSRGNNQIYMHIFNTAVRILRWYDIWTCANGWGGTCPTCKHYMNQGPNIVLYILRLHVYTFACFHSSSLA